VANIETAFDYLKKFCNLNNWRRNYQLYDELCAEREKNAKYREWYRKNYIYDQYWLSNENWIILCITEINHSAESGKTYMIVKAVDFSRAEIIFDSVCEYMLELDEDQKQLFAECEVGHLMSAYYYGYNNELLFFDRVIIKGVHNNDGVLEDKEMYMTLDVLKKCYNSELGFNKDQIDKSSIFSKLDELKNQYAKQKRINVRKETDLRKEEIARIITQNLLIEEEYQESKQIIKELDGKNAQVQRTLMEILDKLEDAINTRDSKEKEYEEELKKYQKADELLNETKEKLNNSIKQRELLKKRVGDVDKNNQEIIAITKERYQAEQQLLKLNVQINDKKKHELLKKVERLIDYGLGFLQEEDMATKRQNIEKWTGENKQDLTKMIKAYVKSKQFNYGKRVIESFVEAMFTNQLIILYGPTGTGKTSLPQLVADSVGGVCQIVSVQSNWNDDQDLLGFYNVVQKKYIPTKFLDILVDAQNNPDKLYFVVLDEMNLAQVEYYFAKILSAMEIEDDNENKKTIDLFSQKDHENSRDKILFKIENLFKKYMDEDKKKRISDASKLSELDKLKFIREILAEEPYNDQEIDIYFKLLEEWNNLNNYPSQIKISENVQFVGTINMDASTKNISPKVVDRSFLIELREEEKISDDVEEDEAVTPKMVSLDDIGRLINNNSEFIGANRDVVISMVNEFIKDFNEISGLNLRLSMRGYKRIETMLEGMGKLNSDIDEISILDGDMDLDDNQDDLYQAKSIAADIIMGKVLGTIGDAEISEEIKEKCVDKAPDEIKDKLERMYDDDFSRFNYWR